MSSHRAAWLFAMTLAASLAGCKQEDPVAAAPAAETTAVPAATIAAAVPDAPGMLTVVPASVSGCPGTVPVIADVSWNVSDATVPSVKVEVGRDGEQRKLMVEAGDTGTIKTGPWVSPGVQFTLSDKDSGRELAHYEVTAEPCTTPPN